MEMPNITKTAEEIREQRNAYYREWRKKNPEKVKQYLKNYYEKHSAEIKAYVKAWKKRNPEKVKQYKRNYRKAHRGKNNFPLQESTTNE